MFMQFTGFEPTFPSLLILQTNHGILENSNFQDHSPKSSCSDSFSTKKLVSHFGFVCLMFSGIKGHLSNLEDLDSRTERRERRQTKQAAANEEVGNRYGDRTIYYANQSIKICYANLSVQFDS